MRHAGGDTPLRLARKTATQNGAAEAERSINAKQSKASREARDLRPLSDQGRESKASSGLPSQRQIPPRQPHGSTPKQPRSRTKSPEATARYVHYASTPIAREDVQAQKHVRGVRFAPKPTEATCGSPTRHGSPPFGDDGSSSGYSDSRYNENRQGRTSPRRPLVKKTRKAFIWPRGGRKPGTLGRLKDIMTGRGPDIHIAVNRFGKPAGAIDGPSLGRWSGWRDEVDDPRMYRVDEFNHFGDLPFSGCRHPSKRYDHRTRTYKYPEADDVMAASYYTTCDGKEFLPSFSKHYTGPRSDPGYVRHHPWGGSRFMDPRNFHDDFPVGTNEHGGWHDGNRCGGVHDWWAKDRSGRWIYFCQHIRAY